MRRADRERLADLRKAARAKGLHLAHNRSHIETAHDYCRIALRRGRYGPLIHRPGMHDKYALTLDQAAAAIESFEP